MRYRLLGNLSVANEDGTPVPIPAAKRRALLAILLLQRGHPIQHDALIDALWGDAAPDAARESLFSHVSRLRAEIGADAIQSVPGGYELPFERDDLDVVIAEREVAAGRQALAMGHAPAAATVLAQALARWQGPALAEFGDQPFAQPEIAHLEQLRAGALEDRIEADLALQREHDLVPELEQLVRLHPLRERLWAQLMLSLYRTGRQSDALDRFRELRRTLVADLGLDPSPELQELQRRILRQDPALLARRADGRIVDLPATPTRTFGRGHEVVMARERLAGARILTLTGPGGVGKTRLAVVVAESMLSEHPDGTRFIDLSMVRDPDQVLERIGNAVGGGGRPQDAIGQQRMLIVLDNFEQVVAAAGSVAHLIAACPNLKLIVTSRAPLRIGAERQLEVLPLVVAEAAELFRDRASAVVAEEALPLVVAEAAELFRDRASAVVAEEALPTDLVNEIVERLEGMPLAIELAAARTKVVAITAIRDLLVDQMAFLGGGRRDAPDRHRAIRDTIRWSYELLDPATRAVLRKLSVLAPGFDVHAAMAVGEASIDALAELIDHSLLRRTGDRYAMLETIRAFGEEAADAVEAAAARRRHVHYFAGLVRGAPLQPGNGADPDGNDRWLDVCATNQENLRLAFTRATEAGDTASIVELYLRAGLYWAMLGTTEEVARWTKVALESVLPDRVEDLERVRMVAAESARWSGDLRSALELLGAVLTSATARGDLSWMGRTLLFTALTHASLGEYEDAWARLDQANAIHRTEAFCEPGHLEHTLGVEVQLLLRQDRVAEAVQTLDAFVAAHDAGPRWRLRVIEADQLRAEVAAAAGRKDEAKVRLGRVISAAAGLAFRGILAESLEGLARVERDERPAFAARLVGMADRVRTESRTIPFYAPQRRVLIDRLRGDLGTEAYEAARRAGQAFAIGEIAAAAVGEGPDRMTGTPVLLSRGGRNGRGFAVI
ncbi:MAG: BTAD domain-containing putative transcriptional regulator [Chloroflexota bacterium]